jgi:type IV pilus assembly protein PilV
MDRSDWNLLPPPIDCQAGECLGNDDTARLNAAVWQVHEWQMRVQEHLSNPRVQVCFDSTPFDSSGQSNWDCDNAGDVVVAKLAWNHFDTAGALVFGKDAPRPLVVMPVTAGSPS